MEPQPQHFDFVVLGGGSAGYAAARTATSLGLSTAVVDGAEELGGLCVLRGCMPSKTLIESANRNLTLRRAAEFGLSAHPGPADPRFIRDRKRTLIREFASYRVGQLQEGKFKLIRGMGRFEPTSGDLLRLSVALREGGTEEVTASSALIATGSELQVPKLPGLHEAGFWTSDTLLDAAEIPPSFIVLGGGPIALEMAHYLDGIGRPVTVIQRSAHLLKGMDSEAADALRQAFLHRGLNVYCGTTVQRVESTPTGKKVHFTTHGQELIVEAAEILAALGRKAAVGALGLDQIGVQLENDGRVLASKEMLTSHPRIFVAGDACGPLEVVHLAIQQGEIAARNAAALLRGSSKREIMDYRCVLFGVFTHPEVASVGISEDQAKAGNIPYLAANYPFNDHGKSMVMGETDGFVKLLADPKTGTLLGGTVVGPEATELIHEIAVAMHLRATAQDLALAPHYHPTLSEIWTYPAEELASMVQSADEPPNSKTSD